jgi:hypothetical protein
MQKLYCYVDESGQDTIAARDAEPFFLVAVAVFDTNRDELEGACKGFERESGKGTRKWHKSNHESRMTYLRLVFADERFRRSLCYTHSRPIEQTDFDARTILGIAKAIRWRGPDDDYTSDVYIDGITQTKQGEYAKELRAIGVHVRRVHRARDDHNPLIRLADALAGLARRNCCARDRGEGCLQRYEYNRQKIAALSQRGGGMAYVACTTFPACRAAFRPTL